MKQKEIKLKYEIGQRIQGNKRNITITNIKVIQEERIDKKGRKSIANLKYYKYTCNLCSFECGKHWSIKNREYKDEYWIREDHLIGGTYCSCCSPNPNIVVQGINDILITHPYLVKYFKNIEDVYTHSYASNKEVWMKCPDCGNEKKSNIVNLYKQGFNCKKCSDEIKYPNKFAFKMFEELRIDFIPEYSPDWIGRKRYDFYFELNDKQYILEMDGGFHNNDNKMSGQTKEESQVIDDYKDEMANKQNIEVIRIDCDYPNIETRFKFIKNNILQNDKLNELFDLSLVDFNKCNEYSLSNLIKIACEYKMNNPNITTTEVGKIMGYHRDSIRNWLKIGMKFGWCSYNADDEALKNRNINHSKNKERYSKPIEIFKNGISKGIFESSSELDRKSEELFETKLDFRNISAVCLGKLKMYKGYTFKFV